jgi:hypothetical protein
MIKRKKDTSRRRRLDVPSRVSSYADWSILLVKLWAWLTLNHLASRIAEFANQLVKLTQRKLNLV